MHPILKKTNLTAVVIALVLTLISLVQVKVGENWGRRFLPPSAGLQEAENITNADLFRFDSLYYLAIARNGYSYNGHPESSPNIVFAPAFPLLVRAVSWTGGDEIIAGFVLNKLLLFMALFFLYLTFEPLWGRWTTTAILLAMVTASGSYAFHAYYSESTMLFALSLVLLGYQRQWWLEMAVACAVLGASRLTALPIALLCAGLFLMRARSNPKMLGYALLSVSGTAAYLAFLAIQFGNPFELLPLIQATSWGLFHQPASIPALLTGWYFIEYWRLAFERGITHFQDIETVNLLWTTLAAIATVAALWKMRPRFFALIFAVYFIFIYATNSASVYLISAHRFFVLMVPIFWMFALLHKWIARRFHPTAAWTVSLAALAANSALGVMMTGYFNQGVWYYF